MDTGAAPSFCSAWSRAAGHAGGSQRTTLFQAVESAFRRYEERAAAWRKIERTERETSGGERRESRTGWSAPEEVEMNTEDESFDLDSPSERSLVNLRRCESEESMSVLSQGSEGEPEGEPGDEREYSISWVPVRRERRWREDSLSDGRLGPGDPPCGPARCLKCEAYDAHCKSAAESYRRTLGCYTKTVSELMLGFRTVLERYPELRVDTGDERLHFMVQAALGRNNLVREMVRLSARRTHERALGESRRGESCRESCRESAAAATVCEALNSCYTDGEALRMILERYTDLYVRYMEVWRGMCAKISRDVTPLEFVEIVRDRPGVSHGEPWSEARAYVGRLLVKASSLVPRRVGDECARTLRMLDLELSRARPQSSEGRDRVLIGHVENVRERLDEAGSGMWSWDFHSNDAYFDIRSDLAVLESLIGIGDISVKSLLYERSLLISQLRKVVRNEGSLELSLSRARGELAEARASIRQLEAASSYSAF
uniref:Uncharacterized protein n=1 Tax=Oryzias latipes TaxID=8090 RepID=A0A286P9X8_ORYLA|nr:hypothetical protein [Oryzias latipes]